MAERGVSDDVVRESLKEVALKWKSDFNRGDAAACAEYYCENAVLHANLGPCEDLLKEKVGVSNPAVFTGKAGILKWWSAGIETIGLKDFKAYDVPGGAFPCTIMVIDDNKAVLQSRFRMNAVAGNIHAETWVRDSPSSPWLIESDFFSIEEFPVGASGPGTAVAKQLPLREQLAQVRTLLTEKMGGRSDVDAEMLLSFMQVSDPAFTREAFHSFMSSGGFESKGLVNVDRFLSYIFLKPSDPKALGAAFDKAVNATKRKRLRKMKVFVMDNSLRESTVGQERGHTKENKCEIYEHAKSCGFENFVVAAFSNMRRVDDAFVEELRKRGEDFSKFWFFSEDADASKDGKMLFGENHVPIAMQKGLKYGVPNVILEIDIADNSINWDTFALQDMFTFLLDWQKRNLGAGAKSFVNLRDFPIAMIACPTRVFEFVNFLGRLPLNLRPMGMFVEDPMGTYFPEEVGQWTRGLRMCMDGAGWLSDGETTGLLVTHAHKQWGFADAVILEQLAEGADGIWCSLCEEGAAQGHSCSAVTLANLGRLGNKYVRRKYVTRNLGKAARAVTKLTTGRDVAPRQLVYGPRAVEAVFDFAGIGGGLHDPNYDENEDGCQDDVDRFSLAEFLGVDEPPIRITTLASNRLVAERLKQLFGEHSSFNEETAAGMKAEMMKDLHAGRKEEYTSTTGIAMLYQQVTGTITAAMSEVILTEKAQTPHRQKLIAESRKIFEELSDSPEKQKIDFAGFYTGYAQAYFGCFTCDATKHVLDVIDSDDDNGIDWEEWRFWLLWALRQYPDIQNIDDLHEHVFRHGLIPLYLKLKKPHRGD